MSTTTKLKTTVVCGAFLALLSRFPVRGKMAAMLGAEVTKALVVHARGFEEQWDVLWYYGLSFIATATSCLIQPTVTAVHVMGAMQLVWATRLATFLSMRPAGGSQTGNAYGGIVKRIKSDAWLQLNYILIAALWRICTCIPLWLCAAQHKQEHKHELSPQADQHTSQEVPKWKVWHWLGAVLWVSGLSLESVADLQKARWATTHPGHFVNVGLWRVVRHPNYLGEIFAWLGHFMVGAPYHTAGEWAAAATSPLFTFVLLRYVSGVPLVDKAARAKWGQDPAFLAYMERTPLLWPTMW